METVTREEFLKKWNSYDIPMYTQEEIDSALDRCKDDEYPLYSIEVCPICGHKCLGYYHICGWCGYEPICDNEESYKEAYHKKLEEDPNYIWEVGQVK